MRFADIIGLSEVKNTLIHSVKSNHVAHAQLFVGKPGSANLAMALAYAQYVNCENKQEDDACGECAACNKIQKFIHPDLHFIVPTATTKSIPKRTDAVSQAFAKEWRAFLADNPYAYLSEWSAYFGAENKQCIIPKEESRNIIRTLSMKAFEAEYKIMLIWLPELMQAPAANAILKVLEEPPAKTLFLLVSNNTDALLTTILSRTQPVQIPLFSDEEVQEYLEQQLNVPPEKALQTAHIVDGNLNEAMKIGADVHDENEEYFKQWMRECFKSDFTKLVDWADRFQRLGKETQKSIFQYGLTLLRETMLYKFAGEETLRVSGEQKEFIKNFSKVITNQNLEPLVNHFSQSLYHLERNANPKITFLNLSLQIVQIFKNWQR
ncbi:DNA polymerase III subunit delta [Rapidithrix thailandica]|uniref:DNA polymerase III subunit delta n=1 Tax=Rapidithrix thailandica TaxID=413964 RepID=A0AAW9SA41_9BACT